MKINRKLSILWLIICDHYDFLKFCICSPWEALPFMKSGWGWAGGEVGGGEGEEEGGEEGGGTMLGMYNE